MSDQLHDDAVRGEISAGRFACAQTPAGEIEQPERILTGFPEVIDVEETGILADEEPSECGISDQIPEEKVSRLCRTG